MRVDFEDLQLYTQIHHLAFDNLTQNCYNDDLEYFHKVGDNDTWFLKSSPYHIFNIVKERDTGLYEVWYDYIKRRVERKCTIFDYGAGIGTLEVILLKRYPAALSVVEENIICLDFILWRLYRRGAMLTPQMPHYDYVVSIDVLQYLPPEEMVSTVDWLLTLGDRLFIYINPDSRHVFYNEFPHNLKEYLTSRAKSVTDFHGLLDVEVV